MVTLLQHLRRGSSHSIRELAAIVGAPAETVAADLATLTMCGVPPFDPYDMIDLEIDGDSVTVHIEPPALDRPVRLTAPEARALASALESAGYRADDPLVAKLLAAAHAEVTASELEATVRTGSAPRGAVELHETLSAAIERAENLRIAYFTGSSGRESVRVVRPYALSNSRGSWYLMGFCENAGEERVFRVDRIRSAERTGQRFEVPAGFSREVAPDPLTLPVAEIRLTGDPGVDAGRDWPGATFAPAPDGGAMARVPYAGTGWLARSVVARLGDAEVLSPPEVRDAVRTLAEAALAELG
jgi:proteasome accessory factor C